MYLCCKVDVGSGEGKVPILSITGSDQHNPGDKARAVYLVAGKFNACRGASFFFGMDGSVRNVDLRQQLWLSSE